LIAASSICSNWASPDSGAWLEAAALPGLEEGAVVLVLADVTDSVGNVFDQGDVTVGHAGAADALGDGYSREKKDENRPENNQT